MRSSGLVCSKAIGWSGVTFTSPRMAETAELPSIASEKAVAVAEAASFVIFPQPEGAHRVPERWMNVAISLDALSADKAVCGRFSAPMEGIGANSDVWRN